MYWFLLYPSYLDHINGKFACRVILAHERKGKKNVNKKIKTDGN